MASFFTAPRIFLIIIGALLMTGVEKASENFGFSELSSWLIGTISLFIYWGIAEAIFFA